LAPGAAPSGRRARRPSCGRGDGRRLTVLLPGTRCGT
jgi:hypothetical protein